MRLILGSGSPRRLELLGQLGITPDEVRPPDINEDPADGELPRPYCLRISAEKARAVVAEPEDLVLCADTTVALGRRILGKPEDADQARRFLRLMSGRRHKVITVVTAKRGDVLRQTPVVSQIKLKILSDQELDHYIASDEWRGKAGGYGIQGKAAVFAPWIQGSFTGIVGLPLAETAQLLQGMGYPLYERAA
ncbi:MAG: Maf family protein [Mangrovicoccus sp.]